MGILDRLIGRALGAAPSVQPLIGMNPLGPSSLDAPVPTDFDASDDERTVLPSAPQAAAPAPVTTTPADVSNTPATTPVDRVEFPVIGSAPVRHVALREPRRGGESRAGERPQPPPPMDSPPPAPPQAHPASVVERRVDHHVLHETRERIEVRPEPMSALPQRSRIPPATVADVAIRSDRAPTPPTPIAQPPSATHRPAPRPAQPRPSARVAAAIRPVQRESKKATPEPIAPTIRVSIGRVVVSAAPPGPGPDTPASPRAAMPAVALDEFLRNADGKKRGSR